MFGKGENVMKLMKPVLILLIGVLVGIVGHVTWQFWLQPMTRSPAVLQHKYEIPQAGVVIKDGSILESPEWAQAIRTAESHMRKFGGYYSLARVILDVPQEGETIRCDITKLKALSPEYNGGGGQFRDVQSGGFLFIQHIKSTRRVNGSDPLVLKSSARGTNTVWVPVPSLDKLGLVGDILVHSISTRNQ